MKKLSAAILVSIAIVFIVCSPLHGAEFAPIFPKPGAQMVGSPNLTWAAGDYDLFLLFLYLPLEKGYRLIPVWRYKMPYWTIPDRLWDITSVNRRCFWLVVGLNTSAWGYTISDWRSFQKVGDYIVVFPDPNLDSTIREEINKPAGDIMASELQPISILFASNSDITDISGLEYLVNLEQLWLDDNQISDISPLAGLTNLYELFIWGNQISDISPLAGLTNLEYLLLGENSISDVRPLTNLVNLTGLYLWLNAIGDISPLAGLTNLNELFLGNNLISDISPLNGLTNLELLWLPANLISDISPLTGLDNLFDVWLGDNQITDISPLAGLTRLDYVWLEHNQISDLLPLVQNTGLAAGDEINVAANPLSPISCAVYIPELQARGVDLMYNCP